MNSSLYVDESEDTAVESSFDVTNELIKQSNGGPLFSPRSTSFCSHPATSLPSPKQKQDLQESSTLEGGAVYHEVHKRKSQTNVQQQVTAGKTYTLTSRCDQSFNFHNPVQPVNDLNYTNIARPSVATLSDEDWKDEHGPGQDAETRSPSNDRLVQQGQSRGIDSKLQDHTTHSGEPVRVQRYIGGLDDGAPDRIQGDLTKSMRVSSNSGFPHHPFARLSATYRPHQHNVSEHVNSVARMTPTRQLNPGPQYSHYASYVGDSTAGVHNRLSTCGGSSAYDSDSRLLQNMSKTTAVTTMSGQHRVIRETEVEKEVTIPRRVVYEDVVERLVVIPERIVREEIRHDQQIVRQKIIEVEKPMLQERIVEVPEIEYVEKIVEVPEVITKERVKEIPIVEMVENVIEVPKMVYEERIVEVPEVEVVEVPYETIVEVPEVVEEVVIREVSIPNYVEVGIPEYVDVGIEEVVDRSIPVPIEHSTELHLTFPRIRPNYRCFDVPVFVPRFIEVPVPADLLSEDHLASAQKCVEDVNCLLSQSMLSLGDLDAVATSIRAENFGAKFQSVSTQGMWIKNWVSSLFPANFNTERLPVART